MGINFWRRRRDHWRNWVLDAIPPGAACAEIGVWKGDFSSQILRLARPAELHLIDPWIFDGQFPTRWYGGAIARNQGDMDATYEGVVRRLGTRPDVKVHRLRSLDAAQLFADRSLDWVYIDGDHSTAAVEADIRAWFPRIKAGGALVGDDYDWEDESRLKSVQAAVELACAALDVQPERISGGQYLIRVR